jgi:hypothetical protein
MTLEGYNIEMGGDEAHSASFCMLMSLKRGVRAANGRESRLKPSAAVKYNSTVIGIRP